MKLWQKRDTGSGRIRYLLCGVEVYKKNKEAFRKTYYLFGLKYFEVNRFVRDRRVVTKKYFAGICFHRSAMDALSIIRASPYFDEEFYLRARPDVKNAGVDAASHYLDCGYLEGSNPSESFDNNYYAAHHPQAKINPLLCYEMAFKKQPVSALETLHYSYKSHYETDEDFSGRETDIKVIAYYLPQFHAIPENDEWWGKGFTEWTNVLPARPKFKRHYQPRLPHPDIGAYDLSDINVLKQQAALAKKHGVHGFCFYYYWFSGKKLLEKPLENLLQHPEIDLPFCLCWANENWTKIWDGEHRNVLMRQKYLPDDARHFIEEIEPILSDQRYIRNNGKPVILVYKVFLIPNPNLIFKTWRDYCRQKGLGEIEIWLVRSHSSDGGIRDVQTTFEGLSHDREVEFPPHIVCKPVQSSAYFADCDCWLIKYDEIVKRVAKGRPYTNAPIVRSAMLGWDNTARHRHNTAHVYTKFSLWNYFTWLKYLIKYTRETFAPGNRFIFINAWNEWAEGCYLEPDEKYGYANVNVTSRAIYDLPFEKKLPGNAIVIILLERLGDIIACEPVIRCLKKEYPGRPVYWAGAAEYEDILKYHPDLSGFIGIYSQEQYQNWLDTLSASQVIVNLHFQKRHYDTFDGAIVENSNPGDITDTNYFSHGHSLLEIFSKIAGIKHGNETPNFYRRPGDKQYRTDFGGKYVAIHALAKEEVRSYDARKWKQLVARLIQQEYKVVELGTQSLGLKEIEGYFDATGLGIQDTADIIANCDCFIGVDSGLAHLANALNVKSVILLGKYKAWDYYMPYSGNYQKGVDSKIIWATQGLPAKAISVDDVYQAVIELTKGKVNGR